jgi:flavin-dependent dehydrogenase
MVGSASADKIEGQVVVVGAGPAGSATALHLAQRGVEDVVLLDLHPFPRHKTCGSGLSPRAITTLKDLRIWENVEAIAYPITGLRIVTKGGHETVVSGGDKNAAAICLRHDLDYEIYKSAVGAGVKFVPHFKAHEPILEGGRFVGVRAADGREARGRFVVVANGAHSSLTTASGPKRTIQAIMGWWEGVDYTPHTVEMFWDGVVIPYYGWLFPETPGITYEDDYKVKNAKRVFRHFLDRHFKDRLTGATQLGKLKGHPIVYTYSTGSLWSPGRVVVGEAGRMTHPATGEGIYQGMRSGMFAAEAIGDVLQGRRDEMAAFKRYERRCARTFLPSFWAGGFFRGALHTPVLDMIVKASGFPRVQATTARLLAHL